MRRFITWLFVVLIMLFIIAATCLPAIVGQIAKQKITQYVHKLNFGKNIKVTMLGYDQGWFESHENIEIIIEPTSATNATKSTNPQQLKKYINKQQIILINSAIYHGPFIYAQDASGEKHWHFAFYAITSNIQKETSSPMKIYIIKYPYGNSETTITQNGARFSIPQTDYAVNYSNLFERITYYDRGTKMSSYGKLDGAQITNTKNIVKISQVNSSAAFHEDNGTWIGERKFTAPDIEITGQNQNKFSILDSSLGLQKSASNNTTNVTVAAQAQKIVMPNSTVLNQNNINFSLNNIDAKNLNRINSIQNQNFNVTDFTDVLFSVLNGLNANLHLQSQSSMGNASVQANLNIEKSNFDTNPILQSQPIIKLIMLKQKSNGNFNAAISMPLLKMFILYLPINIADTFSQALSQWETDGYATVANDILTTKLDYAKGQLKST